MKGLRKTTRRLNQNSQCTDRDSNRDPLELESTALPICQSGVKPCSFIVKYVSTSSNIWWGEDVKATARAAVQWPQQEPRKFFGKRIQQLACRWDICLNAHVGSNFNGPYSFAHNPERASSEQPSYSTSHARRQ
jgi:hypothetical protein